MDRKTRLSNTITNLIETAVNETKSTDRIVLCSQIAQSLEEKYTGGNLDYQLRRMDITTTKKILNVIDIYLEQSSI